MQFAKILFFADISKNISRTRTKIMFIRNWHTDEVVSLRDAVFCLVATPQAALHLSGLIKIIALRGIFVAIVDYHIKKRSLRPAGRRTETSFRIVILTGY